MIALVLLAGCAGGPLDDPDLETLARTLAFEAEAGEALAPALHADAVGQRAGVPVAEGGAWTLGPAEGVDGARCFASGPLGLCHVGGRLDASAVAVVDLGTAHAAARGVFLDGVVEGALSPGGEIVATWLLAPPAFAPAVACVDLDVGGKRVSAGPVLGGRAPLLPGAPMASKLRVRTRAQLPDDLAVGATTIAPRLVHCRTHTEIAPAGLVVEAEVAATGLPTIAELRRRRGGADAAASFPTTPSGVPAVRLGPGGATPIVVAPLPRIRVGEASPLLVGGSVDPTVLASEPRALAALRPLLGSEPAVVALDGVAGEAGVLVASRPARRAPPLVLDALRGSGVDAVSLGSLHASDAGAEGVDGTALQARARGIAAPIHHDAPTWVELGGGLVAAVLGARLDGDGDVAAIREQVAAARAHAHVVVVSADPGARADRVALALALATTGADAAWMLGDRLGPLEVLDGVPVIRSLPPLLADRPDGAETALLRLYVDGRGLRRIDVLALVADHGAVSRAREGDPNGLDRFAAASLELGTWVVAGRTVASAEVRDHWPADKRAAVAAPESPPPRPLPPPLPPAVAPSWCLGEPAGGEPLLAGDGVELVAATLPAEVKLGEPVDVRLLWHARGGAVPGTVEIAGTGAGPTWRVSGEACEGVWGFERWGADEWYSHVVRLWPPQGVSTGTLSVSAVVRVGESVARTPDGERRAALGEVAIRGGS